MAAGKRFAALTQYVMKAALLVAKVKTPCQCIHHNTVAAWVRNFCLLWMTWHTESGKNVANARLLFSGRILPASKSMRGMCTAWHTKS